MTRLRPVLGLVLLALPACDSDDWSDAKFSAGDPGVGPAAPGTPGVSPPPSNGGERPPERESESRYLAPVATDKYLWTANPLSGRVALIDATSLAVTLDTAGNGPTRVAGLPARNGRVGALVLNERSDDATLFRLSKDGALEKYPALPTHADANTWAVSPSGRFAIAWTDAALKVNPDRLETFQDITLLSLELGEESSRPLSVGARPSHFEFSKDETHAYAVTEEGLSVISLGDTPSVSELIPLGADPLASPGRFDVSFAPDVAYAVVRREGASEIGIVSLPDGELETVALPGVVTDVDLAPNGTEAWAVLGKTSEVVHFSVTDALAGKVAIERASLGSAHGIGAIALNSDASAAVLYSTVVDASRVTLIATEHLAGAEAEVAEGARRYDLIAPVTAVFPAPDPRFAVAFQGKAPGSQKAGGVSILALTAARSPRIVATDATPVQIAFSPEAPSALVTVRTDSAQSVLSQDFKIEGDKQHFGAYVLDLLTHQVDFVALASPPESAGVIASAKRAFVAQKHPEGRITFISTEDQSVQTLTGFELAARIKSD